MVCGNDFSVPIIPNLTESKPKLNRRFTFLVYSESTLVNPKKRTVDTESKP